MVLFIYYSGHGLIVNGMTVGNTVNGTQFDLEIRIRKLALYTNVFVISLLDCCREAQNQPVITKGSGNENIPEILPGQIVIIHAVGPTKKAVARVSVGSGSQVCCCSKFISHSFCEGDH